MPKLPVILAAASVCAALASLPAEAMTGGGFARMKAATDGASPVEKVACGWYPSGYPQSWAVYNRGWGCRYAYSGYYYDPYLYRPYDRVSAPPPYRGPYWGPRRWWWAWY
jgi:hypothetical protein